MVINLGQTRDLTCRSAYNPGADVQPKSAQVPPCMPASSLRADISTRRQSGRNVPEAVILASSSQALVISAAQRCWIWSTLQEGERASSCRPAYRTLRRSRLGRSETQWSPAPDPGADRHLQFCLSLEAVSPNPLSFPNADSGALPDCIHLCRLHQVMFLSSIHALRVGLTRLMASSVQSAR
jgi:hypothetical protein